MKKSIKYEIQLFIKQLFCHYLPNIIINKIPGYWFRNFYYKNIMWIKLEKGSSIHIGTFIQGACFFKRKLLIDENTSVGRFSYLDCRGKLKIGKNVSISPHVTILTATHDLQSKNFLYVEKEVNIDDYVWIGTGALILPGVKLGKGSVIAAGSVVAKDVKEYTVVGGIPAKYIMERNQNLEYNVKYTPYFD